MSYLIDSFIEILQSILAQGKIKEIHYNITRNRNHRKFIINAIFYCKIRNNYTIYTYLKITKYQILKKQNRHMLNSQMRQILQTIFKNFLDIFSPKGGKFQSKLYYSKMESLCKNCAMFRAMHCITFLNFSKM